MNSTLHPQGRYVAEGNSQAFTETGNGTPEFRVKFRPLERLDPDPDASITQSERSLFLYLTADAKPYTLEKLRLLGWDGEAELDPDVEGHFSFAGRRFTLRCTHEPVPDQKKNPTGDLREKWDVVRPDRPLSKDKIREFQRYAAQERRKANRSAAVVTMQNDPNTISDDDVPF